MQEKIRTQATRRDDSHISETLTLLEESVNIRTKATTTIKIKQQQKHDKEKRSIITIPNFPKKQKKNLRIIFVTHDDVAS